ncbi:MAG: N-acetyltransferase [Proteobacteria bacterium]|nr:MAG: N-acetyltransferase [Pseudomonadota bacterium]
MNFRSATDEEFYLTEILRDDKDAYLKHMLNREISDNTFNIPFPYLEDDAVTWLKMKEQETTRNARPVTFAIREKSGFLIGSVGFDGMVVGQDESAELGYWLAKPYWGQGIMTSAVQKVCELGFRELGLRFISAHVFVHNLGSQKVLKKAKFQKEAYLEQQFLKNGEKIDALRYGLFRKL